MHQPRRAFSAPSPRRVWLRTSAATALAVAAAGEAASQSAPDAETLPAGEATRTLEEIVVTAQKREQNLQDVGIAVTAFTGETLERMNVQDSVGIAAMTAGVHTSGNIAGQNTQFTIRGVTQNDFNDIVESPNAVYLDDGYIAIAQAQTFAAFDIERVEVLKGPQGTLFGRNATGGLVHYISRKPSVVGIEGFLTTTFGRYESPQDDAGSVFVEGAVNAPLGETTAVRAAFNFDYNESYLENIYPFAAVGGAPGRGAGADLGESDTLAGRVTFLWEATPDLSLRLSANGERTDMSTGPYQSKATIAVFDDVSGQAELINVIDVAPGETRASIGPNGEDFGTDLNNNGIFAAQGDPAEFFGRFGPGGDFFGYIDPDGNDFTFSGDFAFDDSNETSTWGVNAKAEWEVADDLFLTSVTDFKSYDKLVFIDVDAAPVNQSANFAGVDATSVTQELRVAGSMPRLEWVAGFFFLNIDTQSDNGLKFPVNSVVPGSPFDVSSEADLTTNSYSLFGHLEYDVTQELAVILGARVIQEEKDYFFRQALFFTQEPTKINQGDPVIIGPVFENGVPVPFTDDTSDTHWAGVARLEYQPTPDLLLYTGVKRGVKAGSFNAQLNGGLPVPDSAIPYGEEILTSYEVGVKSTFLGGLARVNVNGFYYDYEDYQAFLFTGVAGVVINADAEYFGVDVEVDLSPIEGLDLRFAGSWLDAKVKDVPLRVGGPIIRDVEPNYAPEFQFTGMARYEWPLFGGYASVMTDFNYADEFFYNLRNFDADKFDAYVLVNARLGWASADGSWEAALRFENLTDARAGVQGFDLAVFCGCNEISFQPPRWYGVTAKYSF